MKKKPAITLPGKVAKIIKPLFEEEKAQIAVEGAEPLYDEIRIKNELENEQGESVRLKEGDEVDVTIESPKEEKEKEDAAPPRPKAS